MSQYPKGYIARRRVWSVICIIGGILTALFLIGDVLTNGLGGIVGLLLFLLLVMLVIAAIILLVFRSEIGPSVALTPSEIESKAREPEANPLLSALLLFGKHETYLGDWQCRHNAMFESTYSFSFDPKVLFDGKSSLKIAGSAEYDPAFEPSGAFKGANKRYATVTKWWSAVPIMGQAVRVIAETLRYGDDVLALQMHFHDKDGHLLPGLSQTPTEPSFTLRKDKGWVRTESTPLPVPESTQFIVGGLTLVGPGTVWVGNLFLQVD